MGLTERLIEGLPDDTQKLLLTYVKEVKGRFGEQLEGMLLYGSAVRGDFLPVDMSSEHKLIFELFSTKKSIVFLRVKRA